MRWRKNCSVEKSERGREVVRVAVIPPFMIAAAAAIAAISPEVNAGSAPPGPSDRRDADALRKNAGEALSRGEFARARQLYEEVSRLDRADARAIREAGRAALAQGDLVYAVDALTRADALAGHAP